MEETPQPRTIQLNQKGRPLSWIAETSEPNQWELHWNAEIAQIVKWILRNAERAALRNDGESLVVTAGPEENVIVKAVLDYTQYMEVQQEDDRYVINLLSPSSDGLVHDDATTARRCATSPVPPAFTALPSPASENATKSWTNTWARQQQPSKPAGSPKPGYAWLKPRNYSPKTGTKQRAKGQSAETE